MDKINEELTNEMNLIHNAMLENRDKGLTDKVYSEYYYRSGNKYSHLESQIIQAIGFTGTTTDELVNYLYNTKLTPQQIRQVKEIRKDSMYIKLVGETSLKDKDDIDKLLGVSITSRGMTFADENGPITAYKSEEALEEELDTYSNKLSELLSNGTINNTQYEKLKSDLENIYSYYISCSRGEQIANRKISDKKFEELKAQAEQNESTLEAEIKYETELLLDYHKEIQEMQKEYEKRTKVTNPPKITIKRDLNPPSGNDEMNMEQENTTRKVINHKVRINESTKKAVIQNNQEEINKMTEQQRIQHQMEEEEEDGMHL